MVDELSGRMANVSRHTRPKRARAATVRQKTNYELFNCNNFNIRYWSWNYRGCWHQTCPPIDSRRVLLTPLITIAEENFSVVISCHYLPELGLGNLRACCHP